MKELLSSILELMALLPGLVLAWLPMKQHLRVRPAILAAAAPLTLLLAIAGGSLCYFLSIKAMWLYFPLTAIAGVAYVHTLRVTRWKSSSVFLAVCGILACLSSVARSLELLFTPAASLPPHIAFPSVGPCSIICCAGSLPALPGGLPPMACGSCWRMTLLPIPGMCSGYCPFCSSGLIFL